MPLPGMACSPPSELPPHPACQTPELTPLPQHHTSAQHLLAGRKLCLLSGFCEIKFGHYLGRELSAVDKVAQSSLWRTLISTFTRELSLVGRQLSTVYRAGTPASEEDALPAPGSPASSKVLFFLKPSSEVAGQTRKYGQDVYSNTHGFDCCF